MVLLLCIWVSNNRHVRAVETKFLMNVTVVLNHRLPLCILGTALLLGCQTPAAPRGTPGSQNGALLEPSSGSVAVGSDRLIANGGGNFNATDSSNQITASSVARKLRGRLQVPAGLIAQGGANLIAQGGGNIVAQGGANLAVQAVGASSAVSAPGFGLMQEALVPLAQTPLADVEVFVADASGKPERLAGDTEVVARTDADGQFTLTWSKSAPVMVIARLQNTKGESVFWRTISRSDTKEDNAFQFDAASACVTVAALKDQTAVPAGFALDAFVTATQALRPQLYAGKTPKWSDQQAILSFMTQQEQASPALSEALNRVRSSLEVK